MSINRFHHQYKQDIWDRNYKLLQTYFNHDTPRLESVWWFSLYYDSTHTKEENESHAETILIQEQAAVIDYQYRNLLIDCRILPGTPEHKEHFTTAIWKPFTYRGLHIKTPKDLEFGPYVQLVVLD